MLVPQDPPDWLDGDPSEAWAISFTAGDLYGTTKDTLLYVWPVRDR